MSTNLLVSQACSALGRLTKISVSVSPEAVAMLTVIQERLFEPVSTEILHLPNVWLAGGGLSL